MQATGNTVRDLTTDRPSVHVRRRNRIDDHAVFDRDGELTIGGTALVDRTYNTTIRMYLLNIVLQAERIVNVQRRRADVRVDVVLYRGPVQRVLQSLWTRHG